MKKFFTKLNALAKYAPGLVSIIIGKIKVFLRKLILDIAKDIMTGDYTPKSY